MLNAHFLRKPHSMMTGDKLPTFWKAGCPKGGAVGEKRFDLFMNADYYNPSLVTK